MTKTLTTLAVILLIAGTVRADEIAMMSHWVTFTPAKKSEVAKSVVAKLHPEAVPGIQSMRAGYIVACVDDEVTKVAFAQLPTMKLIYRIVNCDAQFTDVMSH